MPKTIEEFLWTIYLGQGAVLTSRLFGIRISTLSRALTILGESSHHNILFRNSKKAQNK